MYISCILILKLKDMKIKNLKQKTRKQLDNLLPTLPSSARAEIDSILSGRLVNAFKTKQDMIYFIADSCEDFDIVCPIQDAKLEQLKTWTKYNLAYYVSLFRYIQTRPSYVRTIIELNYGLTDKVINLDKFLNE